jgi:hypothetical protein
VGQGKEWERGEEHIARGNSVHQGPEMVDSTMDSFINLDLRRQRRKRQRLVWMIKYGPDCKRTCEVYFKIYILSQV